METLAQNFSKLSRGKKHPNRGVKGKRSLRAWLLGRAGGAGQGQVPAGGSTGMAKGGWIGALLFLST